VDWWFIAGLAAGAVALFARGATRRASQTAAASATDLAPVGDLAHLPTTLQRTALWCLADGGFESRVIHGVVHRGRTDIAVTAFDLETLRERRGEWAWLPVEPPFRIAGVVSVAICELPRALPHLLFKRAGRGDDLADDPLTERLVHVAKVARDRLGMPRSYAAEMPDMPATPLDVALPASWRGYGRDAEAGRALVAGGLGAALARTRRRDLVVEVIDALVVVYPAASVAVGADALADLTTAALELAEAVLDATPALSPRGVEPATTP